MADPQGEDDGGPGGRLPAIDTLRGVAICGMVAFHVDWDLAYWGWRDTGPADSPGWMLFGHAVAATFLFVSGMGLMLARHQGDRAALRRIALLAAMAALISAVTFWLFPADAIFFGILHCIALSNLIGLAFLRAPAAVTLLAALGFAMAPSFLSSPGFNGWRWWWLGLSTALPSTLDYRPLLPWLAAVLLGIATARIIPRRRTTAAGSPWFSGLRWAGRHSLPIYLLHQPALFALFFLLASPHPARSTDATVTSFGRRCRAQCVSAGAGQAGCAAACDCVLKQMRSRLTASLSGPSTLELDAASRSCVGGERSP